MWPAKAKQKSLFREPKIVGRQREVAEETIRDCVPWKPVLMSVFLIC